jgi:hypothetical protein
MLFEPRANNVDASVPADDLAVLAHLFDGSSDFHNAIPVVLAGTPLNVKLFISIGDPAAGKIVRRQFDGDAIAGENFDVVHSHLPRNMR